ncbi:unnamed protein product [Ostreobium quekettii]|uniref:Uncharacterized protein n=1 Tax=Ostreobium quekettii TaxID=121088 RepID=A0A8S1J8A5_9CHLO|nr:unnamed protein product [Ostreobium quekettii]
MTVQQIRMVTTPVDVAFGRDATQIVVIAKGLLDRASVSLYTLEQGKAKAEEEWKLDEIFRNEPALRMVSAVSSTGSRALILCCSEKKEAKLISDKGDVLSVIEPNSFRNHDVTLSGDGRFLSVASFTADAKVWEVQFSRDGTFKGTPKVMDLKGHKGQVTAVAISQDSRKAATASKDGHLKIWNLDVRHHQKEDAKCLLTTAQEVPKGQCYGRLVFGPREALAAAWGSHVHLIDTSTGRVATTIDDAHDGPITSLAWAPTLLQTKSGEVAVLATAGEDGRVRLWKAPQ